MDAIKKKMQAMKMEKENAIDKSEQLEQKLKDTEEQKAKIEEDLTSLQKKYTNLENEFDIVSEKNNESITKLEASDKRVTEEPLFGMEASKGTAPREIPSVSVDQCENLSVISEIDMDYLQSPDLSQESGLSQSSVQDIHVENNPDGKAIKKKSSGKKTKKKKVKKVKDGGGVNEDGQKTKSAKKSEKKTKTEKSSKTSVSRRPEPEGGNCTNSNSMDEYDRIIYTNKPIFSDLEMSEEESSPNRPEQNKRYQNGRRRPGGIQLPTAFGLNSASVLKFSIIEAELKNIIRGSLKRLEDEVKAVNRRVQLLEEDLERAEERVEQTSGKLEEASKSADESERGRKVLESRSLADDERIDQLEAQLKEAKYIAEDADRKYDEAARKLAITEVDHERAETRLEAAEAKIVELSEELHVVGNNMKCLQNATDQASQREDAYEETIRDLTQRLKEAENRSTEAERNVNKLQKEVDRLEDELLVEKEKYKAISDELDQTFAELAGY